MSRNLRLASLGTILLGLSATPLGALAPQQGASPVQSVERPGSGTPVCGLGRAFHAGRRAALRAKLGSGVVILRGLPDTRDYAAFQQDKTFWYLTGVESPGAALVMDAGSGTEQLYLPRRNKRSESWEGEKWDCADEWVHDLTGFADVRAIENLSSDLAKTLKKGDRVWTSLHPFIGQGGCFDRARPFDRAQAEDVFDGRPSREAALAASLAKLFDVEVADCGKALEELRLVKEPEEIAAMQRAGRSGALAMVEAMRSTRAGLGEWELEGLMRMVQLRNGASGPAYHAIVGSGPNSTVLHYSTSSRRLAPGEVLLIDFAPEVDHFTSDITRTWPVDGTFSPRQAELYDAVLAAQKAGIAAAKPGARVSDVDAACRAVLLERGFGSMIRHGACHWIGMEVHDVGDYRQALKPGMAFTVEPGLYEDATGIGVRIEDVVVITADGCMVVSADVPKERAEIEALIRSKGLFDADQAREASAPRSEQEGVDAGR